VKRKCVAMTHRLELSRLQILCFRRRCGALDERLPAGAKSLRRAAWAGLQDSAPRAALLSIHARVEGTSPTTWEHPSLIQLWGPRFNDYLVASKDLAVFSLGRLSSDASKRGRAHDTADRLHAFLNGRRMPFGQAGQAMGSQPNSLRYAAPTGRVLLRWDGSRQPVVWTTPAPDMDPRHARLELARRYLHVFGPATAASFARWAGIQPAAASAAFRELAGALAPVRTLVGDAWILVDDETAFRAVPRPPALARLLPSGDAFYLAWGSDREILVPEATRRSELWTSRVWPGALLVSGEIAGVWRRSGADISLEAWRCFPWRNARRLRPRRALCRCRASRVRLPSAGVWWRSSRPRRICGSDADSDGGGEQETDGAVDGRTVNFRIVTYPAKCRSRIWMGKLGSRLECDRISCRPVAGRHAWLSFEIRVGSRQEKESTTKPRCVRQILRLYGG